MRRHSDIRFRGSRATKMESYRGRTGPSETMTCVVRFENTFKSKGHDRMVDWLETVPAKGWVRLASNIYFECEEDAVLCLMSFS